MLLNLLSNLGADTMTNISNMTFSDLLNATDKELVSLLGEVLTASASGYRRIVSPVEVGVDYDYLEKTLSAMNYNIDVAEDVIYITW